MSSMQIKYNGIGMVVHGVSCFIVFGLSFVSINVVLFSVTFILKLKLNLIAPIPKLLRCCVSDV